MNCGKKGKAEAGKLMQEMMELTTELSANVAIIIEEITFPS
jgi:hypothetical protein